MPAVFADEPAIKTNGAVNLIDKLVVDLTGYKSCFCLLQNRVTNYIQYVDKLVVFPAGILFNARDEAQIILTNGNLPSC